MSAKSKTISPIKYYDGTRLLSQKDMNGEKPEIYISNTNRSAGKTTFYNRLVINRFLRGQGQFYTYLRIAGECDNLANSFFGGVTDFFPGMQMTQKMLAKGKICQLFLDDKACGFGIPLSSAEYAKKASHIFKDVTFGLFDEFQTESGRYMPNEVNSFISIHQSVARGGGSMARYVPVVMISNLASTLNPYYRALGLRSQDLVGSSFWKGDGVVVERRTVQAAQDAMRAQPFNRAFAQGDNRYSMSMTGDGELLDNTSGVSKKPPEGNMKYMATVVDRDRYFGLRWYTKFGQLYMSETWDPNGKMTVTGNFEDVTADIAHISVFPTLKFLVDAHFRQGICRYESLAAKDAYISLLTINV